MLVVSPFPNTTLWMPASNGENGQLLFTVDIALQFARLHLSELESVAGVVSNSLEEMLQDSELRLGYELVPEVIAEHALRTISAPRISGYVLHDRHGQPHMFMISQHPVFQPVCDVLALELLPASAVRTIAKSSAYADAVSKALNAGEKLADLSIYVAPIGLKIHQGRLETE